MKRGDIVICINDKNSKILILNQKYLIEDIVFDQYNYPFLLIEYKNGLSYYCDSCNFIELETYILKKRYKKIIKIKNRIIKNKFLKFLNNKNIDLIKKLIFKFFK